MWPPYNNLASHGGLCRRMAFGQGGVKDSWLHGSVIWSGLTRTLSALSLDMFARPAENSHRCLRKQPEA